MQAKRFMLTNINISSLLTAPLKLTIHLLVDFQKDVKTFYRLRAFGANEKINHRSLLQSNFRTLKPLFFLVHHFHCITEIYLTVGFSVLKLQLAGI